MGHYDDQYDREYETKRQEHRRRAIQVLTKLEPLMDELDTVMRQTFRDHPFKTGWFDFQKEYIAWQYEEGLVIKDPQLIIDALKGKE